jgi:hypothetical protein
MLKRKKQQFATNIDDEKITKGHYIVGKINLRVGKKTTKSLPLRSVKIQFKTLELGFKPM